MTSRDTTSSRVSSKMMLQQVPGRPLGSLQVVGPAHLGLGTAGRSHCAGSCRIPPVWGPLDKIKRHDGPWDDLID